MAGETLKSSSSALRSSFRGEKESASETATSHMQTVMPQILFKTKLFPK